MTTKIQTSKAAVKKLLRAIEKHKFLRDLDEGDGEYASGVAVIDDRYNSGSIAVIETLEELDDLVRFGVDVFLERQLAANMAKNIQNLSDEQLLAELARRLAAKGETS